MQGRSNASVCSHNWETSMHVFLAGGEGSTDVCGGVLGLCVSWCAVGFFVCLF